MTAVGKLLQKSVFIEGTSCTFKTTILSRLEAEGYPCVTGDFAEHAARHPGLRKQLSDPAMKLVYLTYLYLDHKPYCIIDRTWFATVVYSIVNRSTVDSVASECLDNVYDIPIDVITSLQSMPVLVILESKPEENLARMQHRGSNIDCNESVDYIIKQNIAFRVFANAFHWETITRLENETPEQFQDRCVMRLKRMYQANIDPILRQLATEDKLH